MFFSLPLVLLYVRFTAEAPFRSIHRRTSMRRNFPAQIYIGREQNTALAAPAHPHPHDMFRKLGDFVQPNFCYVHLRSPLIHIWLWPPFFSEWITRTHMKFVVGGERKKAKWSGGEEEAGWRWNGEAQAMAGKRGWRWCWCGAGKSITENCLFQISLLVLRAHVAHAREGGRVRAANSEPRVGGKREADG